MSHSAPGSPVSRWYVILVCLVAALGGLLFGYDTAVISGAIGFLKTRFAMSSQMEGWAASCALVGCVLGAGCAGMLNDRFGRKKVLFLAAVFFFVSAVGTALPRSLPEFIVFRILGGIGVGAASLTSPLYIAEIAPARFRGRMVSVNQFAIVSGISLVYFVNYFIAQYGQSLDTAQGIAAASETSWNVVSGWRWMFGSGMLPSALLLILLFFVPESPRWLMKQGREEQARGILTRVDGAEHAQAELAEIRATLDTTHVSLEQLLQPGLRAVLFLGVALAVLQQITGINVVLYYGPEIFKKTGIAYDQALLWTTLVGIVNIAFTVAAIWTVDRLGRKPLMLIGAAGMGLSLISLGAAFYLSAAGPLTLLFVLGYIAFFALSVGPVTWVILSEIFPTQIRGRAMSIATLCLWAANFVVSQTFPMMNDNETLVAWFHHGFPFWCYAAFCAVLFFVTLAMVPETKGKSLEEIERFWTSN